MPLPVSHSLAGATLWALMDSEVDRRGLGRLVVAVTLANAPDLDLLPGMWMGDPNRFHQTVSHSFLVAIAFGLVVAVVAAGAGWRWPLRGRLGSSWVGTALFVALLWASHVSLDLITSDPSPPVGMPALWPLSEARWHLASVFARGDKLAGPASAATFVGSILSEHNLKAALWELALLGPVCAVSVWWRRR